ncbi:L-type lectin-domain containing receptor kinase VIII.2 [Ziziphus jujuba]|uniref:L-type lectin-domain containing receptor kinase VIII.2 n=1 Tax=Ziziphus jujuba TaxID=326968 RepID=A0A6P4B4U8_ZIZJJ|nr:L-type lectin-domain containing receptor kinase VIII.2 [Ziziphus jujuba]
MAALSISGHFTVFTFLLFFFFRPFAADSNSSFSFPEFGKNQKLESNIAFYGDAKVVNGGYAVQITSSSSSSAGRVMYKKPIKLVEGKPQKLVSFSTYLSFSVSPGNGDGLAFIVVPSAFDVNKFCNCSFGLSVGFGKSKFKVIVVKFYTLSDSKYDGLLNVHVGIDVGSVVSAKVSNSSTINMSLHTGNKSHAWIDYEAGSKRLEVRLSKFGDSKPSDPLLWYPIDLSRMWDDEEAFVGLSASSWNFSQTSLLYSWIFEQRHIPQWMHSEPLDPKAFAKSSKHLTVQKRKDCLIRVLAAMIFGAACGALAAFTGLYLWTIFGNRRPVVPEEYAVQPVDFEYKKVKVVVDKATEDGKQ